MELPNLIIKYGNIISPEAFLAMTKSSLWIYFSEDMVYRQTPLEIVNITIS